MSTDELAGGWAKVLGGDRKQFNMFIEKMMDGFAYHKIVVDKAGKPIDYIFLEVNHAFEKMTGLKRAQIIGKKVTEVLIGIEKDPADWIGVYGRVALTGEPVEFENHAEPLGKWYRISAYCPEKGYFVALFEDISERKKAEYELWQAKKDWERTFDSVPDFVAILDNQYRIVRANRAMAQQLGVTPEKAIGLFCYECVHGLDNSPDFCPHAQTVKDGKEHLAEVHEPRLGGDFLVTTTPLRDEQGRMVGSVHVARNITERKQREREIEDIARFPSENPNPIFRIDEKGTILYGNLAGNSLLTEWNSKIGERAPEDISRVAAEALAFDKKLELEETYGAKTFSLLFAPIFLEGYVNIYANDVTERKKAEESMAYQNNLLSKARDAIFGVDSKYDITYWNKGAEDLLGWTKEEAMGKNFQELIPIKIEGSSRAEELAKQEATGHWEGEVQYRRKDGSYVSVELSATTLRSTNGELRGVVTTARDITERKKAEEALRESELRLRFHAENIPLAVVEWDSNFVVTRWAGDSEKIFGWNNSETIGKPIMDLHMIYEQDIPIVEKTMNRLTSGEIKVVSSNRNITKDGRIIYCTWYNSVFLDEKGKMISVFSFVEDNTAKVRAEKSLEENNRNLELIVEERTKQLKDSERLAAIGATAGMVGHDIRNPLQAITGDLYLAKTELSALPENEIKANTMESLTEIEKNIDYINKIVADLQDYARPLNPRAQETSIKSVFNEILAKNKVPKNIKVVLRIDEKAERVMADPDYVKRVAANLTLNAMQAMPNGGKLTIHAYTDKETDDVLIAIKDTGIGIPEEVKPKLFTPMMTTKSKGQGFGLAVVKRMTEALGGTVSFESQEGKGTTFTIRLPRNR